MKQFLGLLLLVGLMSLGGAVRAFAQTEGKAAENAAAPRNIRADFLDDLKDLQEKVVSLAEAFPADKYTWRPGEGVRSVSEVFLHIAGANYSFPNFWGVAPPAGIERKGFEKSTTDRARIVEQLKESFDHMRQAVQKVPEGDLEKNVKWFGGPAPFSEVLFGIANHMHEHLGQAIAYARVNSVVPPWTAARQAKQQEQQKPKE